MMICYICLLLIYLSIPDYIFDSTLFTRRTEEIQQMVHFIIKSLANQSLHWIKVNRIFKSHHLFNAVRWGKSKFVGQVGKAGACGKG